MGTNKNALAWIVGSDTGSSSKALWAVMMGQKSQKDHPIDTADLGRCLRLLELVPEWKARIGEMASVSPYWEALAARWTELTHLMVEECGEDFKRPSGTPRASELMREILTPVEKTDKRFFRLSPEVSIRIGE